MKRLKVRVTELWPGAAGVMPPGKATLNLPDLPKEPSIVPVAPVSVVTCYEQPAHPHHAVSNLLPLKYMGCKLRHTPDPLLFW